MSTLQGTEQWLEEQQEEFANRTGAAVAFWPEFRSTVNQLLEEEPAKGRVAVYSSEEDPNLLTLSAGLFDLKLACDTLSDTVFYAFTSSTLKTLVPRESAIFSNGQLNLVRGYWGVIDSPGPDVAKVFADDPQTVEHFPLASRFAQWCIEQLLGGFKRISALEKAAVARTNEGAAKKEAKNGGRNTGE
jgi:hypothetical protein